jgi:cytochrome o ubiquinol oxidase subunit IV
MTVAGQDKEEMQREFLREFRSYLIGGGLSAVLTGAAFAIVGLGLLSGLTAMVVLAVLAVLQIVVHFRFFMHIDLQKSHRDDLQLILFTGMILAIMVAGTIWILFSQWDRMM